MKRAKDKKKRLTLITTLPNVQDIDKTRQQKTQDKKKRQEQKTRRKD
jgi:hypothetical protein